jgi:glycosyltransferase involved in cell wall biosynthesis
MMDNIPLVSVIIPLYNKRPFIKRAIESIQKQTFANWELIIVDDGSTDGSCSEIPDDDSRIQLIHQENKGPGAARNAGLARARGEYVAFLDADDEWLPLFLERGLNFFSKVKDNIATVSFGYDDPTRNYEQIVRGWDMAGVLDGVYELSNTTYPGFAVSLLAYMSPWSTIARKEIVKKYGGFFDRFRCLYGEDAHLWLKVLLNEKIGVSREKLVIFHSEASNLSKNLSGPHPIAPFLLDPSDIFDHCPIEKKELLKKILAIRAMNSAISYSIYGIKTQSGNLLKRFCKDYKPKGYTKAFILYFFSPILPCLRQLKRWLKYLTGMLVI